MEQNSLELDLIQTFNQLIMLGLNEQTVKSVERVLIGLIDHKCDNLFNTNKVCNFLIFLKSQQYSSFLINHLIDEVERKSLRLYYTNNLFNENKECKVKQDKRKELNNLDIFGDTPLSKILENNQ